MMPRTRRTGGSGGGRRQAAGGTGRHRRPVVRQAAASAAARHDTAASRPEPAADDAADRATSLHSRRRCIRMLRQQANFCVGVSRRDADSDVRRRRRDDGLQRHHDAAEGESRLIPSCRACTCARRSIATTAARPRAATRLRRACWPASARGRSNGPRRRRRRQQTLMSSKTSFGGRHRRVDARRRQPRREVRRSTKARARRRSTRAASARRSRCRFKAWNGSTAGLRNVSGKAQANATDSRKLFDMIMPDRRVHDRGVDHAREHDASRARRASSATRAAPARATSRWARTRPAIASATARPRATRTAIHSSKPATADVAAELQHVVMTFSPAAGRKTYVNGLLTAQETAPTTLAWTNNQTFVIGNETTNDRLWLGVFQMVAIHNKALSAAEVQQNFAAGVGELRDAAVRRVEHSRRAGAHRHARGASSTTRATCSRNRRYVGGTTGVRVKNIRIAVNDTVPVAAQAFRRVDTTVLASGTELSRLGAVIPVAQGPDTDRFHLEFEALGTRFGTAEAIAPSSPPPRARRRAGARARHAQLLARQRHDVGADRHSARQRRRRDVVHARFATRCRRAATCSRSARRSKSRSSAWRSAIAARSSRCQRPATPSSRRRTARSQPATRTQIADRVYDNLFGTNLANQPDRAAVSTELVDVMNDLGCTAGCTAATARTALQATCAAALSSAAVTIN